MTAIETVLEDKTLEQLVDTPVEVTKTNPTLTQVKVEKALKYLKYQNGSQGNTEGNEEFIGVGDEQICSLVEITKDQLGLVRKGLQAKIVELTPEPIIE